MTILTCMKCGKTWNYKGQALRATCPSCLAKVPVSSAKTTIKDLEQISVNVALIMRKGEISEEVLDLVEKLKARVAKDARTLSVKQEA